MTLGDKLARILAKEATSGRTRSGPQRDMRREEARITMLTRLAEDIRHHIHAAVEDGIVPARKVTGAPQKDWLRAALVGIADNQDIWDHGLDAWARRNGLDLVLDEGPDKGALTVSASPLGRTA